MHEMSLAEGVLGVVADAARANHPCTVRTVRLQIGALAAVELDALRFAFEVVKRGSVADGARLDIVEVPGSAWCMQCSRSVAIAGRTDPCPECGSWQLQVTGGSEMRVMELELA
ncbi:MAG: hydrogenase maturation nickel metallochaperone HypA [Burkholderiales bacterium]|jgi:hydrogenase nickel incorporation protein HypA/HybF|nr:hydrogenase maturation nickel metallochaperone HypA [Burkholderiales bacterium]